jgi:hypothetical protein
MEFKPTPTQRSVGRLAHDLLELHPTAKPRHPHELLKRQSVVSADTCGFISGDISTFCLNFDRH